ncbi:MAG TPA: S8 family serine peptidase [Polyangiaceae bacterium]|nr:S8 family serine peptidase [Polyangiaceae bacterium]
MTPRPLRRRHLVHEMVRASAPVALLLALSGGDALAAPSPKRTSRFVDGAHAVELVREAAPALDAAGRVLTPVSLSFEDGRRVRASVDETTIVRLAPGAEPEVAARGGKLLRPLMPSLGLWLAADTSGGDGADLAERLGAAGLHARGVLAASPNLYFRMTTRGDYTPNDPRFPGQWYFQNLGMPEAWGLSQGDAGTTVVVVDTGCDLTHVDLVSKLDQGRDVVDGDDDPSYDPADSGAGHGTSCAGIVAAATDNGEGIAGACPACRLRCVRLLSDALVPVSADVDAFQFALDVDADVVSNSWGFVDPMPAPSALADAIDNVAKNGRGGKGAIVVFAAGNDDRELADDEMEALPGVVCVGAINNFDESTPFTNRGNAVDVVAPTGTLTTDLSGAAGDDPGDYTSNFGGTSSACPVVAGIAGLLVSVAPDKTSDEIADILVSTTRPAPYAEPDAAGHDPIYGYGIVDPPKALKSALGLPTGDGGGGAGGAGGGGGGGGGDASEDGCGCRAAESPAAGVGGWLAGLAILGAMLRLRRAPRGR